MILYKSIVNYIVKNYGKVETLGIYNLILLYNNNIHCKFNVISIETWHISVNIEGKSTDIFYTFKNEDGMQTLSLYNTLQLTSKAIQIYVLAIPYELYITTMF